jgi:uncharacterized protein YecE (DUF72 family)
MHKKAIWAGTSGWSYAAWKPAFYPRELSAGDYLAHYATQFPTVELNSSFYRLPPERNIHRWRSVVPSHFRFALKAWGAITHERRLRDCEAELTAQLLMMRQFGEKLGPVLFQLPPSLAAEDGLLESFLGRLPQDYGYAMEFRHPSWFCERTYATLARHGVALCHAHFRQWTPADNPPDLPFLYIRLHGAQKRHDGPYDSAFIARLAARLRENGHTAYVYFNNTMHGDATHDAAQLLTLAQVCPVEAAHG